MTIDFENPKRIWKIIRKGYDLELVNWRHQDGPENWNIYVCVYPNHKWYTFNQHVLREIGHYKPISSYLNKIKDVDYPPMHGGITSLTIHSNSIEMGCDYQHDGDNFYSVEIDPYTFEPDIKALIDWFDNYNPNGEVQGEKAKAPSDNGGQALSLDELYQITNKEVMSE
jgi:hypothetical protein